MLEHMLVCVDVRASKCDLEELPPDRHKHLRQDAQRGTFNSADGEDIAEARRRRRKEHST